ncbi:hypothetical protein V7793_06465 [Streptomyces sp. KLMMK]|uniref:hypothetical protein n=1 Tax=Streptomyces sp. KLMMK TaxID=3109353 RepID=UPI002FFDF2F6
MKVLGFHEETWPATPGSVGSTTYHLALPDEFVGRARAAGFQVPAVGQERLVELTDEVQALRSTT